jgi:16S rRNA (adenine1518-N6/adenine1519-N6)-dimethyltransferase
MPARGKRRALGQHFLRDSGLIDRIVSSALELARETACRTLLEVGPGRGALTRPLLERLAPPVERLLVCETDRELAERWRAEKALHGGKLEVREGDFVQLPEKEWLAEGPLGVASNLPYSAATAILTRLARHAERIPFMVLMFQAEVAERLRALPDTKDWGSLSLWIQNRWDVTRFARVAPGAFSPPPEVDSEVVLLRRRSIPRIEVAAEHEDLWESLLRASFAHRRKMLRSGLPRSGVLRNALERSGVDGTRRAEALQWEDWHRLFQAALQAQGN